MNVNAIIAGDDNKLVPIPYDGEVSGDAAQIEWRGAIYSHPRYVAEWMELLDASGGVVGVELDMARDLHPPFWQWLHRFANVSFDEHGGARVLFHGSGAKQEVYGPYLPVEAFQNVMGDFVVYVPELHSPA